MCFIHVFFRVFFFMFSFVFYVLCCFCCIMMFSFMFFKDVLTVAGIRSVWSFALYVGFPVGFLAAC